MNCNENRSLDELRREAAWYASFFGDARRFTGSLFNVLRSTPEKAVRQAAVAAVYYSSFPLASGQKIFNPASWFTSACRHYAEPEVAVPAEVQAWAEMDLSLEEIRRCIQLGIRLPSEMDRFGETKAGLE